MYFLKKILFNISKLFIVSGIFYSMSLRAEASNFTLDCNTVTQVPTQECVALQNLYNATNGDTWNNFDALWRIWATAWWSSSNICDRNGIQCNINPLSGTGNITEIHFQNNNLSWSLTNLSGLNNLRTINIDNESSLSGTLPIWWWNIFSLQSLSIKNTRIWWSFPSEWWVLSGMRFFEYNGSLFTMTWSLPPSWSGWINLTWFFMNDTNISWSFPQERSTWTQLENFTVSNLQNLNGILPSSWSGRTNLKVFDMENLSNISWVLPPSWNTRNRLQTFRLKDMPSLATSLPSSRWNRSQINNFSIINVDLNNSLPDSRSGWTKINSFSIISGWLVWSLPTSRSSWIRIDSFLLDWVWLTGTLPSSRNSRLDITSFSIKKTPLSWTFPDRGDWHKLRSFIIDDVPLTGSLPSARWSRQSLNNLSITNTYNNWSLPASWWDWDNIRSIVLVNMPLVWSLPDAWGSFYDKELETLVVSRTNISWNLPDSRWSFMKIKYLYIVGNKISGTIPLSWRDIWSQRSPWDFQWSVSYNCLDTNNTTKSSFISYFDRYFTDFQVKGTRTDQRQCSTNDIWIKKTVLTGSSNLTTGGRVVYNIEYFNSGSSAWTGNITDLLWSGQYFMSGSFPSSGNIKAVWWEFFTTWDTCYDDFMSSYTGSYANSIDNITGNITNSSGNIVYYTWLYEQYSLIGEYTWSKSDFGNRLANRINEDSYIQDLINSWTIHNDLERFTTFYILQQSDSNINQNDVLQSLISSGWIHPLASSFSQCGKKNYQNNQNINITIPAYTSGNFQIMSYITGAVACDAVVDNTVSLSHTTESLRLSCIRPDWKTHKWNQYVCGGLNTTTDRISPYFVANDDLWSNWVRRNSQNWVRQSVEILPSFYANFSMENNIWTDPDMTNNSSTASSRLVCPVPPTPPIIPTPTCIWSSCGGWGWWRGCVWPSCNITTPLSPVVPISPTAPTVTTTPPALVMSTVIQSRLLKSLAKDKPKSIYKRPEYKIPPIIPSAGTPIDKLSNKWVMVFKSPKIEIQQPDWIVYSNDRRKRSTNIDYWINLLPDAYDRDNKDYIVIPKLWVVAPLSTPSVSSTDYTDVIAWKIIDANNYLQNWLYHYPASAWAWETGNNIVIGHSSYYTNREGRYKTIFTSLPLLENNDEIWAYTKNKNGEYTRNIYIVNKSFETDPHDTNRLSQTKKATMTLITCTPIWTNKARRIVRADLKKE